MIKQITDQLDAKNIRWSYGVPRDTTNLPYIIIWGLTPTQLAADNKVWHSADNYRLEYYSRYKDFAAENVIQGVLNDLGIYWEKSDDIYLDDQKAHRVDYDI